MLPTKMMEISEVDFRYKFCSVYYEEIMLMPYHLAGY